MKKSDFFLSIALPVPLNQCFEYSPIETDSKIDYKCGARVLVQFGHQTLIGIILEINSTPKYTKGAIRPITNLIDRESLIPTSLINLCKWLASYYQHPLGETLFTALPSVLRQGKPINLPEQLGLTREGKGLNPESLKRSPKQKILVEYLLENDVIDQETIKALGFSASAIKSLLHKGLISKQPFTATDINQTSSFLSENPKPLNTEQLVAFDKVKFHHFQCHLINGITGSGKTEIYLQLMDRVLQTGKSVLFLVPEIGLTHQTIERIKNRFNQSVAELHSHVSEARRSIFWHQAKNGQARIILGTRLASLAPVAKLGLIIVDEEHDASYKQQDGLKYNARDLCIYRAKQLSIPVVLGSATPSLESLRNSIENRYMTSYLKKRAGNACLPSTQLLDIKQQPLEAGMLASVIKSIEQTLAQSKQAMVFINRRGYAPILQCHDCGWIAHCDSCSQTMSYHKQLGRLVCHQCDRYQPIPHSCPSCSSTRLVTFGVGTEQLESHLKSIFTQTPIYRIDRDTTRKKGELDNQLAEIKKDQACILIGTQMLAKGHHLPNLKLVAILETDQGLFSSDFRSVERMGQLITQVVGRVGRSDTPGLALIQTHHPNHPLIDTLLNAGYESFSQQLLELRKTAQLPPYWHMASVRAESKRAEIAVEFLSKVKSIAIAHENGQYIQTLGPIADKIEKINDRHRFQLHIKSATRSPLHSVLKQLVVQISDLPIAKRTKWSVDVDPLS